MAGERITTEVFEILAAQARLLWGETDAERQRPALSQTAEEIAVVARTPVPADLEPRFLPDFISLSLDGGREIGRAHV